MFHVKQFIILIFMSLPVFGYDYAIPRIDGSYQLRDNTVIMPRIDGSYSIGNRATAIPRIDGSIYFNGEVTPQEKTVIINDYLRKYE